MDVVLDLETTGVSSSNDSIIEIGAVIFNKETFEIINTFRQIVIPEHGYDRWYDGGKLTKEFVKENGIPLKDAMEKFHAFIGDVALVDFHTYNAPFDRKFFEKAIAKYPCEYLSNWTCILQKARKHLPVIKSHKLEDVCKHYGISTEEAHRALDDCLNALEVLERRAQEGRL